jgi:hypothetical protein
MRDNHITEMLDSKPFASLSETDLATMRAHVASCASCSRAYDAAQISGLLIKEHADEAAQSSLDANPFFQTRVMAAWRERRETNVSALRRLWNATGALVTTMAVTTAALAVLAFVAPSSETMNQPTAALVPYSAESVVLDQSDNDQVTDDQVLNAIYSDDDEGR